MVVIATNHPKYSHQGVSLDNEDIEQTRAVLQGALKLAIPNEEIACPPIVYIGMNDNPAECLSKIKDALVARESTLPLKFNDGICARCSVKIRYSKENHPAAVVHSNGTTEPYFGTKCHPSFVPKYTNLQKVAGGLAHIATLGVGLLVKKITGTETWPGFTNSDEVCSHCEMSPGAMGCMEVREDNTVRHSNKL